MDSVSGVFVPVEVLAKEQGTSVDAVVERIQNGELVGRRQSNGWHVLVRVPQQPGQAPQAAPADTGPVTAELRGPIAIEGRPDVVVRDFQVSIGSLIGLLFKLVIAAIVVGVVLSLVAIGLWLALQAFGQPVINALMAFLEPYLQ